VGGNRFVYVKKGALSEQQRHFLLFLVVRDVRDR
jgi:hypothetical protein